MAPIITLPLQRLIQSTLSSLITWQDANGSDIKRTAWMENAHWYLSLGELSTWTLLWHNRLYRLQQVTSCCESHATLNDPVAVLRVFQWGNNIEGLNFSPWFSSDWGAPQREITQRERGLWVICSLSLALWCKLLYYQDRHKRLVEIVAGSKQHAGSDRRGNPSRGHEILLIEQTQVTVL